MSIQIHKRREVSTLVASSRQQGVVLFIALIALVTIMLAAVALVRSVDTSSLIAGNVAFRRAATSSADGGLEDAISWLFAQQNVDKAKNPDTDPTHILNITAAASGYYAKLDSTSPDIYADATWTDANSLPAKKDVSGNDVRYIIQRMCKTTEPSNPTLYPNANCVFSDAETKNSSMGGLTPEKISSSVMYRVTVRVQGPRNTISYIQGFIY